MFKKILLFVIAMSMTASFAFAKHKEGKDIHKDNKDTKMHEDKSGCPMMHACPMMDTMNTDKLKIKLKLTDEQVNKINALKLDHMKKMLKSREELAPKEIKVQQLLIEDTINIDEVKILIMDIAKVRGEMQISMIQYRVEIEKILTPEQKVKFKTMNKQDMPKHKDCKMKK